MTGVNLDLTSPQNDALSDMFTRYESHITEHGEYTERRLDH